MRSLSRRLVLWLLASVLLTACTVGESPPATLNADLLSANNNNLALFDASPTPIQRQIPTDPALNQLLNSIQSDQLVVSIDALSAMRTRHVLSAGFDPASGVGIGAARDFILSQFRAIHGPTPLQVWTQPVMVTLNRVVSTSDNVIAVLPGTDPAAGTIVVGAHYDTENVLDPYSADLAAPGADDNASGVAALLAIAQAIAEAPPRATVIFVAFTAEETGLQGSTTFINAYLNTSQPPIVPRAMINLDTVGSNLLASGKPAPNIVRLFSATPDMSSSRQLARWLSLVVSAYPGLPQIVVQSEDERLGRIGDQQAFSAAAIPSVHLVEGSESPVIQRSANDTLSQIGRDYLVGVTRAALIMIASLAAGPDAPPDLKWQRSEAALTWTPVTGATGYVLSLRSVGSAAPDQILVLGSQARFAWAALPDYATATLCAFNAQGRLGAAAPEISLR